MPSLKCRDQATVQIVFGKKSSRLRAVLDPLSDDVDGHLLQAASGERHAVAERRVGLELLDEEARIRISGLYAQERPVGIVEAGFVDQTRVAGPRIESQPQH